MALREALSEPFMSLIRFERHTDSSSLIYSSAPQEVPALPKRHLRLYLPPDYFKTEEPFPLAVMLDGQNLFGDEGTLAGGWHIHEALDTLTQKGVRTPVVLGIDHCDDRDEEMTPWDPLPGKTGKAEHLLAWLVEDLFPRIKRKLHVDLSPEKTMIGGSSLGGMLSLYALFEYPEAFGKALIMSPALWPGRFQVFEEILLRAPHEKAKIYVDHGKKEVEPPYEDILFKQTEMLVEMLECLDFIPDKTLKWVPDPEGEHNEKSWARRLPEAMTFLYG